MEIMELATKLGQAVKADPRIAKLNEAKEAYDKDSSLQMLIFEYNTQQTALAEEYKKNPIDKKVIEAIEGRLNEIVNEVNASPVYAAASEAQEEVNKLMSEIYAEIEFQITGEHPCTHDCHSCGSDCGHHHH